MAREYDVPLLGSLPLTMQIREQADGGVPTVAASPESAEADSYRRIARNAAARLSLRSRNKAIQFPNIVIQNT
jgi:ATP-binding protein involved in chromosome partitioning